MDTLIVPAPSSWASLLINGDDSGLSEEEIVECDAWVKELSSEGWQVVGVSDEGEEYFAWRNDATSTGGNVVDYILHKVG